MALRILAMAMVIWRAWSRLRRTAYYLIVHLGLAVPDSG
jgi:hypothetical protein